MNRQFLLFAEISIRTKCKKNFANEKSTITFATAKSNFSKTKQIVRGVAQPGSVSVWGAGGRKFKSCHPDN